MRQKVLDVEKAREDLRRLIQSVASIYWWGTGSRTVVTLSALGKSVCSGKRFVFIDSDEERKGLVLPLPFLTDYPIELPSEACPRMEAEDLLVIASMFSGEILSKIEREGYVMPRNVVHSIMMV